jgi:geranyl-CoA carboxylase alpha subunit
LPDLWHGWSAAVERSVPLQQAGRDESWRLQGTTRSLLASCGEAQHCIEDLRRQTDGSLGARVDGRPLRATFACAGKQSWWHCEGLDWPAEDRGLAARQRNRAESQGDVAAPMHGRVTQVLAEAGSAVQAGALLVVMEAMKMEHQLVAPIPGRVRAVHARAGEQVAARKLLVEIAPQTLET